MIDRGKKLLFIHIPKNAGTTIERTVFSDYNFKLKYSEEYLSGYDSKLGINLQHARVKDIVENNLLSEADIHEYRSFAVVRNPFTRALSGYVWLQKDLGISDTFSNFLRMEGEFSEEALSRHSTYVLDHFYTQSSFVTLNGEVVVKDILRFESLNQDFERFNTAINGDYALNTHFKKNRKVNKFKQVKLLTPENMELIKARYSEDFQRFGYPTEFSKLKYLMGSVPAARP